MLPRIAPKLPWIPIMDVYYIAHFGASPASLQSCKFCNAVARRPDSRSWQTMMSRLALHTRQAVQHQQNLQAVEQQH